MKTTGTYVLIDENHGYKQLADQPWPVTAEALKRLQDQGYVFQTAEVEQRRAFFAKIHIEV